MIREEADVLDLSRTTDDPAEAWSIALMLSAADYDSDLSVWYSVHREVLLEAGFRPLERHGQACRPYAPPAAERDSGPVPIRA